MIYVWAGFVAFILLLLVLDLGVFHRKLHAISIKESLGWVAFWVALGLAFTVFIYFFYEGKIFGIDRPADLGGKQAAVLYLTGYVIEESLSMDNMFVIAMILTYFGVPARYQHRVLFWGILGALVMRMAMIGAGAALVRNFQWVLYIFGAFLIYSAIRILWGSDEPDPQKNILVRIVRRFLPVTTEMDGQRFLTRKPGRLTLTPLAMALLAVESADVIFAVDSIPAIFAITTEPFIIFTSNVFAILGLRSLYFALAGIMDKFRYLKVSLSVLLAAIGAKMLLKDVLHDVPGLTYWVLGAVVVILATGVVASIVVAPPAEKKGD